MAPFDRAKCKCDFLSIFYCKYSYNHVPFLRYLSLKNVLTMKSNLGITHPANLCTIAEIYRPSVILLILARDWTRPAVGQSTIARNGLAQSPARMPAGSVARRYGQVTDNGPDKVKT